MDVPSASRARISSVLPCGGFLFLSEPCLIFLGNGSSIALLQPFYSCGFESLLWFGYLCETAIVKGGK